MKQSEKNKKQIHIWKEKYEIDWIVEEVSMLAWQKWSMYKSEKLRLNDFSQQNAEIEMKLFHEILPKIMKYYLR